MDLNALLAEADWLRPLARRLARTSDLDADDLLQDSVEVALTSAGPRDESKLRPWLRRVMLNLHAMRQRGDTRRRMREEEVAADPGLGAAADPSRPDELVIRAEFRHALASAMLRIREPYRRSLLWRYFEGWSVARIAKQEGVAAATVRSRVQRGLALLRADLDASWGESWQSQCLAIAGGSSLWKLAPAAAILALVFLPFALNDKDPSLPNERASSLIATSGSVSSTGSPEQSLAHPIGQLNEQAVRIENTSDSNPRDLDESLPPLPTERVLIRTVDDESGEPIEGAEIRTWTTDHYNRVAMRVNRLGHEEDAIIHAAPVSATTNGDGIAELELLIYSQNEVHASAPGRSGYLSDSARGRRWGVLDPPPALREYEIRLRPVRQFDVIVLGPMNQPVQGAHVALFSERPMGYWQRNSRQLKPLQGLLTTATSNSNGVASLRVAEFKELQERALRESFPLQLKACLLWPGELGKFVPVPLASMNSPTTLRVPELGSLRVNFVPNEADVMAILVPESGEAWTRCPRLEGVQGEDGSFQFQGLPLGKNFKLVITQPDFARLDWSERSWDLIGPTAAEPQRVIQVDPSPGPWLRGRLRMPDQRPLPFRVCQLDLLDRKMARVGGLGMTFVNPDGSFVMHLASRQPSKEKLARVAFIHVEPYLEAYSVDRPFPYTPGESIVLIRPQDLNDGINLGDIVLGSAPLLSAGRILDSNGEPIIGVRVHLNESGGLYPNGNNARQDWTTHTNELGEFRIAAVRLPVEGDLHYEINAVHADYRQRITIEVEPGADDLELRFPATGGIRFGYRHLPPGWFVSARLEPATEDEGRPVGLGTLYWRGEPGSHSQLTEHGIPEGRHILQLQLVAEGEVLQRESFGPFLIQADEVTAPPEIQDIDWMQLFRATRYELVDASGQAVVPKTRPELFVGGAQTTGIARTRGSIPMLLDGNTAYLAQDPAQKIGLDQGSAGTFSVNGYLPQRIDHPLDDQRIVLEAAPKIHLRVTGAPTLDPPQDWTLAFKWLDAPEHYLVSSIRTKRWTSEAREIELPGWGRYQLNWFRTAADGSSTQHTEITRFYRDRPREVELAFPTELQAPN